MHGKTSVLVISLLLLGCAAKNVPPHTTTRVGTSPGFQGASKQRSIGKPVASLENGQCSICIKEGLKSTVMIENTTCEPSGCATPYKGGIPIVVKCQSCSGSGYCSKGHFVVSTYNL